MNAIITRTPQTTTNPASGIRFTAKRKTGYTHNPAGLLNPEIKAEITTGLLPDVEKVCVDLNQTFNENEAPFNAVQFLDVLKDFKLSYAAIQLLLKHPRKRHVLVHNDLIKIVLIEWLPNEKTDIHGHPEGGCAFKVLKGSLVEKRFQGNETQKFLGSTLCFSGSLSYIHNSMAYHAVENIVSIPAISLHVYTPGISNKSIK